MGLQAELAAGLQTPAEREASLARLMAARQAMGAAACAGGCAGNGLGCAAAASGCRGAPRPGGLANGVPGPGSVHGAHAQHEQHDIAAYLQARRGRQCKAGLLCLPAQLARQQWWVVCAQAQSATGAVLV